MFCSHFSFEDLKTWLRMGGKNKNKPLKIWRRIFFTAYCALFWEEKKESALKTSLTTCRFGKGWEWYFMLELALTHKTISLVFSTVQLNISYFIEIWCKLIQFILYAWRIHTSPNILLLVIMGHERNNFSLCWFSGSIG